MVRPVDFERYLTKIDPDLYGSGNTIYGGDGDDDITVIGNDNKVYGGAGNDTISYAGTNNLIDGGAGNDTIQNIKADYIKQTIQKPSPPVVSTPKPIVETPPASTTEEVPTFSAVTSPKITASKVSEQKITGYGTSGPIFSNVSSNAALNIEGSGKTLLVSDTSGSNEYNVNGNDNRVEFVGDSGSNTYNVSGKDNVVSIYNLGSDDTVNLSGSAEDWTVVDKEKGTEDTARESSYYVTLYNENTGTYVKVASDRSSRDTSWLLNKIKYS